MELVTPVFKITTIVDEPDRIVRLQVPTLGANKWPFLECLTLRNEEWRSKTIALSPEEWKKVMAALAE